jgi:hypothetical protein
MYNTVNTKRKGNLLPESEEIFERTHKHTETCNISAITDAFLDQKRVNVCEHMVITAPIHWSSSNSPDNLPLPVAIHTKYHQLAPHNSFD